MEKDFNKKEPNNNLDNNQVVSQIVKLTDEEKDAKYIIDPAKKKVFDDFADRERKRADDLGVNTLELAKSSKSSAEGGVEIETKLFKEYTKKVEKLRDEIDVKKSNIITRIVEFRKIRELHKELDYREKVASLSEDSLAKKKELVDAYDYLLSEEQKLASLIDEANNENKEWDERKKQEFLEEEKRRTVKDLATKHGVFFVHDIVDADWKPSANNKAVDTKSLDFLNQLDIVLGLAPTISVSTLKRDTKQHTFVESSWGVFLSSGRVTGGTQNDAGTVAMGLRDRDIGGHDGNKTVEGIDIAINGYDDAPLNSGHNELVVENPEVSGIYVKWGIEGWPDLKEGEDILLSKHIKSHNIDSYGDWWRKMSSVLKRGAPIFVLDRKNNHVRMLYDINVANKTFKVTPEYDPANMVDMPGIYKQHTGSFEKKQAVMRVFDKASGLILEDEREQYLPDGTEKDSRSSYSVH